jgi:hypothetical protein
MIRCPFDAAGFVVEAEFVGDGTDDNMRMLINFYECPNGHAW